MFHPIVKKNRFGRINNDVTSIQDGAVINKIARNRRAISRNTSRWKYITHICVAHGSRAKLKVAPYGKFGGNALKEWIVALRHLGQQSIWIKDTNKLRLFRMSH